MLTTEDIIKRRMDHEGLHIVKGRPDDLSALIPYLLLDIQYQRFESEIYPLRESLRHEMTQLINRWSAAYNSLNDRFWRPFRPEEYEDVTDRMDELTAFVHNELTVLDITIMNCAPEMDLRDQKILSTCMLCNILALCALTGYKTVYVKGPYRRTEIHEMQTIADCARELSNRYYWSRGGRDYVGVNGRKEVIDATTVLVRKFNKWMDQQSNQE